MSIPFMNGKNFVAKTWHIFSCETKNRGFALLVIVKLLGKRKQLPESMKNYKTELINLGINIITHSLAVIFHWHIKSSGIGHSKILKYRLIWTYDFPVHGQLVLVIFGLKSGLVHQVNYSAPRKRLLTYLSFLWTLHHMHA